MIIFESGRIQYHLNMKKGLLVFLCAAMLISCKHKKTAMSSDEITDVHDFIDLFPTVQTPFQFTDTIFKHHKRDSLIHFSVVSKFVPDSVFSVHLGKNAKPKIYTLGKV